MNVNVLCSARRVGVIATIFTLLMTLPMELCLAQGGRSVSGKVTDPSGVPVVGAGVLVLGTTTGTTTDLDGKWNLSLKNSSSVTLEVSSLGYRTVTVDVPVSQSVVNVVLPEDMTTLEDVVVVA